MAAKKGVKKSSTSKKKASKKTGKKATKKSPKKSSAKKTAKKMSKKSKKTSKKTSAGKKTSSKKTAKKKSSGKKTGSSQKAAKQRAKNKPAKKRATKKTSAQQSIDMQKLRDEIQKEMKSERKKVTDVLERAEESKERGLTFNHSVRTGIEGLDALLEEGIPSGATVLIAGGAGSGKTITCLQTLVNHAKEGRKCLYMSFEESESRLKQHMEDFGWEPDKLIKDGNLKIKRFNPFEITRSVDAMLLKAKGELLIDVDPVVLPDNYKPDFIVVDSLTAIASAFSEREDSYRIYIEQLFRYFEEINATSFLITETKQIPTVFSPTGVEEFLADGVIVLYNIRKGPVKENAIEVLKMRGVSHQKKIVAMQITDHGVIVYPTQEVFEEF